jgi:hypothetical protein
MEAPAATRDGRCEMVDRCVVPIKLAAIRIWL